jgi:hypothetical protein
MSTVEKKADLIFAINPSAFAKAMADEKRGFPILFRNKNAR